MSENFQRPNNVKEGFLINTDLEGLENYKKAKKKFSVISSMESQINNLTKKYEDLDNKLDTILNLLKEKNDN